MKKIYFLFACLITVQCIHSQDLSLKIPANANAVATLNAGKLMKLLPPEEWDKTALGKKFKAMREKDSSISYSSLKDLGVDLSGSIYYFHTEDDSMHYNTILIPLSDASKMDQLLGKKELLRLANNVRKVTDEDSSGLAMWNNQQLVYVNASIKDAYFNTKEVAERHGLSYHDYSYDQPVTMDTAMVMPEDPVIDSVSIATEKAMVDSLVRAVEEAAKAAADSASAGETMDEEVVTHEGTFDYYNDIAIKKRLSAACAAFTAGEVFYKTPATNILKNTSFIASNKPDAVASLWVDRPMDMYYRFLPYYSLKPRSWYPYSDVDGSGYKTFSSYLTMDEKKMNFHSAIEMTAEIAAMQQKVMDRKINKQFYKYINTDSMLGYMSWAVNTKNYLQEFPALMERTSSNMGLGIGSEEYSLAAEFFSFLLDEEAIGNMVKGDMMVLFDGVYKQETTYTDYTYNDNFEQTPVVKTKQESIPRFLFMLSSEENNLARRLIKYGINKSTVKAMEGFCQAEVPHSPMRFYFMYKDDIFFLTNSLPNIRNISTGNFKASISKDEKKFIGDHNMSLYINPANIAGKLSAAQMDVTESLTETINTFNKMGVVRMKLNPIKNNISSTDIWMDVPAGNNNALSLLLSFFDGMVK